MAKGKADPVALRITKANTCLRFITIHADMSFMPQ